MARLITDSAKSKIATRCTTCSTIYVASRAAAARWEVPGIGPVLLAAHAVLDDYPTIGLADALNVVLAREFRTDVIATFDHRHFRVVRPLTPHSAFRLLPEDVP